MYVGTLSGSSVSMMNDFMRQQDEDYMIISERFYIEGYGQKFYISFVLGKMVDYSYILSNKLVSSNVIMSDLKKACEKRVNIESNDKKLQNIDGNLCLSKITLPVYALLKKCFNMALSEHSYEKLIRFEKPIDINAQCDNRGGYCVFQCYGETSSFPLVGFVIFKEREVPFRYDFNKIKI